MFIREAKEKADRLVEMMRPHCERIEIGGSIRRGCQIVKDIEIVAIPRLLEGPPLDLFNTERAVEVPLHKWALEQESARVLWIKPGTSIVYPWEPKPLGRYWRALVDSEIKLDLFLTRPAQWGAIFLIRTGSKDFSRAVMTYARKHTRLRFHEGAIREGEGERASVIATPEERDVFRLLGIDYVEPRDRAGWQSVKVRGARVFSETSFRALLSEEQ